MHSQVMMREHVSGLQLEADDIVACLVAFDIGQRFAISAGKGHLRHEHVGLEEPPPVGTAHISNGAPVEADWIDRNPHGAGLIPLKIQV